MRYAPALSALCACLGIAVPAGTATAQTDLFSAGRFHVTTDVRLVASDAEVSWLQGGYGKTRFGEGDGSVEPVFAEAVVAWSPRFTADIAAVVSAEIQDGQDPFIDVSEAYVTWRAPPVGPVRVSGRAGLYFPLISLEHDGPEWSVNDTLTPSAINSWVAEEVKVAGLEATARVDLMGGAVAATAGLFGHGDKAGTLLAFRGWALHDLKSVGSTVFPLPPIGDRGLRRAEPISTALIEIDDRMGAYGRLEWQPNPALALSVFGYDNAGDRVSRIGVEGSWDTSFVAVGLAWQIDGTTRAKAQYLAGTTAVGPAVPGGFRASVDYASAYGSVSRDVGPGAITARIDYFEATDLISRAFDNNDEQGWAGTLAYRWDYRPGADITVEALTIDSDRPSRLRLSVSPDQTDVQMQMALRNRF